MMISPEYAFLCLTLTFTQNSKIKLIHYCHSATLRVDQTNFMMEITHWVL